MNSFDTDVLVVGGGPVGLTLGCALRMQGASCRVIDALDAPVTWSKAAVAHARTMEVFESLGVADAIVERAKVIHGVSAYAGGRRVLHVVLDEVDSPYPYIHGVSQRDTEAVLAARFSELGGAIERSKKLATFTQDEGGVMAALVRSDGSEEVVRARWIVGCDGAHSTVRHALDLAFEGAPYEERIVQTDARVSWPRQVEDDEIVVFLAPDGPVACFPFFRDGRYRVLKMYTDEPPPGEPTLETFQAMLDQQLPGTVVSDPAWIVGFRIHHRLASRYRVGRAFLAGDAAHIHSPAGGQGMNTGIQDAHNLAWKLALVARGAARPALLDSYEAERRPVAAELLRGTDAATRGVGQAVKFRNPLAVGLRDGFMALASRLDFVRANAAQTAPMLDRNYRGSPVVAQHRRPLWQASVLASAESELPGLAAWTAFAAAPEPGDRAPDVTFADGLSEGPSRLFELLDPARHTLLLFDGEADTEAGYRNLADIAARVSARCGDAVATRVILPGERAPAPALQGLSVVADARKALHDRYGARSECLYLVRPDGHVAYRSQPADGDRLAEYLDTIFAPRV